MTTPQPDELFFTRSLMNWHANVNERSLPWKSEQDPYRIWLSEVILQQTRALQGLPYYLRFTETYPTISDLAAADDNDVFRIWQGLGYYNRCKNMLATARFIAHQLNGRFPDTYEGLLQLKGIGPYTASAIASFAYRLPNAVVDGNVFRVLSRYFNIPDPIDSTIGKNLFGSLAQKLMDTDDSAAYNQAIMDLGATVCTPRKMRCSECPLQARCAAYAQGTVALLPVKGKKITVRTRYFNYILLTKDDQIWIEKRTGNDIWENLHQPYLIETNEEVKQSELKRHSDIAALQLGNLQIIPIGESTQRLTHQLIRAAFYKVILPSEWQALTKEGVWMSVADLKKTAFPKTVVSFLENNLYF